MQIGDNVLVVTNRDEVPAMDILFGKRVEKDWNRDHIDWNSIDSSMESRVIVMTRTKLNGKTLGSLRVRQTYGVNVSRVMRGDIKLLAVDSLHLQYGDRLTVLALTRTSVMQRLFSAMLFRCLMSPISVPFSLVSYLVWL